MSADAPADPFVLLVEDNDADALLIEEAFDEIDRSWSHHRLQRVTCLREALDVLAESTPACVLLDLGLPDATELRALERLQLTDPGLPVIVLTGNADPVLAERALRAGAQDFLVKRPTPPNPEVLARAVSYAVGRGQAAEALVASNQQLASFSAMVAHDLRSPLSVATGMLQLVQRKGADELSPTLLDLVERAERSVKRATDLVAALLMYATAKRPDENREPVDLGDAFAWAVSAVGDDDLRVEVTDELPVIIGSVGAFRQVFQNLVSNARTYAAPDRPPRVRVTVDEVDDDWIISVIDDGPGIPADQRESAFAEGERLGQTGDGFGLGLPAVKATIERYHGTVELDDAPDGPGLAVRIRLPKALSVEL